MHVKPRLRRRPEEAQREILEAADSLLREGPFHELSVDAVMQRTTLSRNAFYAYFADRYELLAKVVEPLGPKFDEAHDVFLEGTGDLLVDGREALLRVARIFAEDGHLLSALQEASAYDANARTSWQSINEPQLVIEAFAGKIREETEAGEMVAIDPEETARALVGMDIHYFLHRVVGNPDVDVESLTDVLLTIWARTLLVSDPAPPPARR